MAVATYGIERRPSGADRWLGTEAEPGCSASVRAIAHLPRDKGSIHADKGTVAHMVYYLSHVKKADPNDFIGQAVEPHFPNILVDAEMADAVRDAIDYEETVKASDPPVFVEAEISLPIRIGTYVMDGTADRTFLTVSNTLHVMDYKNGAGVPVSAVDNPQAQLYTLGVLDAVTSLGVQVDRIVIHIMQPRRDSFTTYERTRDEMEAFRQRAMYAAIESDTQNADGSYGVFRPSKKACMWCPLKKTCPARTASAVSVMSAKFGLSPSGELPPLEAALGQVTPEALDDKRDKLTLSDETLAAMYPKLGEVISWAEDLKDYVFARKAADPSLFPGLKFVAGNKSRDYPDRAKAVVAMCEAGLVSEEFEKEPAILTPAQTEKALKEKFGKGQGGARYKKLIAPVVKETPGSEKPRLVAVSEKGEPITLSETIAEKFGIDQNQEA